MGKQNVASLDGLAGNNLVQISDYAEIVYGDSAVAKEICTLPAGAVILGYLLHITEACNSGDSDLLDIGNATTADAYVANVSTAQSAAVYAAAATTKTRLTADTTVLATYTGAGTAATAGAFKIAVEWVPWGSRDE